MQFVGRRITFLGVIPCLRGGEEVASRKNGWVGVISFLIVRDLHATY